MPCRYSRSTWWTVGVGRPAGTGSARLHGLQALIDSEGLTSESFQGAACIPPRRYTSLDVFRARYWIRHGKTGGCRWDQS
jgi:hypothetical protein